MSWTDIYSGTVVSTVATQQEGAGFKSIKSVPVGYIPPKDMQLVRLTGNSKLSIRLDVSANGCLSYPCDRLVICPECTLLLTFWQLG